MSRRSARPARLGAGLAALAVTGVFLPAGTANAAGEGDVDVINTETVQVYTDASGEIQTRRVYEQLTLTGQGPASFENPIEERGLRNLDGFGGFEVADGVQLVETDVDGVQHMRTVSDYDGDLPLDVSVEYVLDGEEVDADDVVGEDGELEVSYTVRNVTGAPQEITFPDGQGGTITETVEVPLPMVGSLSTTLPASFTEVRSDQANMAGDGKGGTKMSFTMTLVPPIGSDTATFGYTARIRDGVVPRASLTALPVNPLESPTFATAATSYQGGAETGATLTAGATEIDSNLLKIRDGASKLLNGLIQLRNGSEQLEAGLAGEAAPGARKLADGTLELDAGLGRLDQGAGQLADGAGELSAGANRLGGGLDSLHGKVPAIDGGASDLLAGQRALVVGLAKLYAAMNELPESVQKGLASNVDYQRLLAALSGMVAGIGQPGDVTNPADPDSPRTLLGGVNAVRGGLSSLLKPQLASGVDKINNQLLPAAKGSYQVMVALAGCPAPQPNGLPPVAVLALPPTSPCFLSAVAAFGYGAPKMPGTPFADGGLATQLSAAAPAIDSMVAGLDKVRKGLSNPGCNPMQTDKEAVDYCGLSQAAALVLAGVPTLVDKLAEQISGQVMAGLGTAAAGCDAKRTLRCGAAALVAGQEEFTAGITRLVAGVNQLQAGGARLAAGAEQLAGGAGQLSTGASDASEGSGLIAGGAGELADGLLDASAGAGRLAAGLGEAAEAAPALPEGADRLSEEGMGKLIEAGKGTAQEYGKLYAIVDAGSERAQAESMALGAPAEARGLTAYSYEITGEDGEGGRNMVRALGAAVVGGLGLGAVGLRRRFLV